MKFTRVLAPVAAVAGTAEAFRPAAQRPTATSAGISRVNQGRAVTIGTRCDIDFPPLYACHQYTVMYTRVGPQGQRFVVLRNPHASNPEACPTIPGSQHEGVLKLSLEQVREFFDLLCF
jgi:hypothetical protein